MTDEQHAKLNEVAVEVYRGFLEKYSEEWPSIEDEIDFVGTCYGYMLVLATLGYQPDKIGKDAMSGVDKLMELVQDD
jgi:poly(3-hydroxyalkanoate) synthetase